MSQPQIPQKPLERIALTCSGGGYRAASYHLGAMAYLHRLHFDNKPLLDNVKLISTVSGGRSLVLYMLWERLREKIFKRYSIFW
jgi:hypothetical protein